MRVPDVFPAVALKTALFPTGSPERSAAKEAMESPSGSEAATETERTEDSGPTTVAGAFTDGTWSTLLTVTAVVAEPERRFEAVKVTL